MTWALGVLPAQMGHSFQEPGPSALGQFPKDILRPEGPIIRLYRGFSQTFREWTALQAWDAAHMLTLPDCNIPVNPNE